jgi:hypothetical protein
LLIVQFPDLNATVTLQLNAGVDRFFPDLRELTAFKGHRKGHDYQPSYSFAWRYQIPKSIYLKPLLQRCGCGGKETLN